MGEKTSAAGGTLFSMSLPFWNTAGVGALKCLTCTSFCSSIRESSFATLKCFRMGRFESNRSLVRLVRNSFLFFPVLAFVSSAVFNDCILEGCTSACFAGEDSWTFERWPRFKTNRVSRNMIATPPLITQYSDFLEFRAHLILVPWTVGSSDSSLRIGAQIMLGTAPAAPGLETGAGGAIELSAKQSIAAFAKPANLSRVSMS